MLIDNDQKKIRIMRASAQQSNEYIQQIEEKHKQAIQEKQEMINGLNLKIHQLNQHKAKSSNWSTISFVGGCIVTTLAIGANRRNDNNSNNKRS
jgi:hypothetical protein